jgi:Nucleotidyltransferase of unknown function (DUF6036)
MMQIRTTLTELIKVWDTANAMPLEKLTRSRLVEALNLLGELAEQEQVTLELCLFGGSAMMLAYSARETTKDVDVIARPSEVALRLAAAVAQRLNLDESWMNNDVQRFVSDRGTFAPLQIQELESAAKRRLKITRASAGYLLAMKCLAGRSALPGFPGDIADIRFLIRKMDIRSLEQVQEHLSRFYPDEVLAPKVRETIQGLLGEIWDQDK